MKSKKKVLDVYIGIHETYTRYSQNADEEQNKEGDCFLKLHQGAILRKSFGNPGLDR